MAINLMELVDGFPFPGTKTQIVQYALEHDAGEEALEMLEGMPEMYFDSLAEFGRHAMDIELLPGAEMNLFSSVQEDKTLR